MCFTFILKINKQPSRLRSSEHQIISTTNNRSGRKRRKKNDLLPNQRSASRLRIPFQLFIYSLTYRILAQTKYSTNSFVYIHAFLVHSYSLNSHYCTLATACQHILLDITLQLSCRTDTHYTQHAVPFFSCEMVGMNDVRQILCAKGNKTLFLFSGRMDFRGIYFWNQINQFSTFSTHEFYSRLSKSVCLVCFFCCWLKSIISQFRQIFVRTSTILNLKIHTINFYSKTKFTTKQINIQMKRNENIRLNRSKGKSRSPDLCCAANERQRTTI